MSNQVSRVPVGTADYAAVVEWLYEEARLLDNGEFLTWFELMTEDVRYEMPTRIDVMPKGGPAFFEEAGLFQENHSSMKARVKRLQTDQAWAEQPRSRTRHLVTNVLVDRCGTDEFQVFSTFLVTRARADRASDTFSGERHDVIRRVGSALKLARRTILLDQTVIKTHNLSFFF